MAEKKDTKMHAIKLDNCKILTTEKGPHGGGNKYNQIVLGNDFIVNNARMGHKQQGNVK